MTEQHECEWQSIVDWWRKSSWFRCRNCGAEIEMHEAEARLNEYETLKRITERLKAGVDEMMDACKDDPNEMGGPFVSLSWVANILDGKDD